MKQFLDWSSSINDKTLAGEQVGSFDAPFLENECKRANLTWPFGYRSVDLHSLSYERHLKGNLLLLKNGTSALRMDITLAYAGLPEETRPYHALTGAKFEAEAFSRLIFGKNLLPEFSRFAIPEYLVQGHELAERFS